jgi:hypothetical protein
MPIVVVSALTTAVCELGMPPVSKNRGHANRDSSQLLRTTLMSCAAVPAAIAAQPASLIRALLPANVPDYPSRATRRSNGRLRATASREDGVPRRMPRRTVPW